MHSVDAPFIMLMCWMFFKLKGELACEEQLVVKISMKISMKKLLLNRIKMKYP